MFPQSKPSLTNVGTVKFILLSKLQPQIKPTCNFQGRSREIVFCIQNLPKQGGQTIYNDPHLHHFQSLSGHFTNYCRHEAPYEWDFVHEIDVKPEDKIFWSKMNAMQRSLDSHC